MDAQAAIARRAALLFGRGEAEEDRIEIRIPHPEKLPIVDGMRYNGQQWVDASRPDRPFVPIVALTKPGLDMFGGSGLRKPARLPPKKKKTRRRGGI